MAEPVYWYSCQVFWTVISKNPTNIYISFLYLIDTVFVFMKKYLFFSFQKCYYIADKYFSS